uniref:WD_REPEATS_REGION domain-containing protein n=1 Tax=Steinernema glaseri TaxID=37863 RepID=A0A1I8AWD2_9BILA
MAALYKVVSEMMMPLLFQEGSSRSWSNSPVEMCPVGKCHSIRTTRSQSQTDKHGSIRMGNSPRDRVGRRGRRRPERAPFRPVGHATHRVPTGTYSSSDFMHFLAPSTAIGVNPKSWGPSHASGIYPVFMHDFFHPTGGRAVQVTIPSLLFRSFRRLREVNCIIDLGKPTNAHMGSSVVMVLVVVVRISWEQPRGRARAAAASVGGCLRHDDVNAQAVELTHSSGLMKPSSGVPRPRKRLATPMKEEVEEKAATHADDSNDSAPPQKKWRSPPFSDVEKMMLAERYSQNYVDYNLNVNAMSSKCETGLTRASLLRRWSEELTAVGVSHRTPAMVEQKIRDYIKKITKYNNKLEEEDIDPATKTQMLNGRSLSPSSRLFFETLNKPTYRRIRQARCTVNKKSQISPASLTLTNGDSAPSRAVSTPTNNHTAPSSPSPVPSNNASYCAEGNENRDAIDLETLLTNSASTSGSSTDGVPESDAKSTSSQLQNHVDENHCNSHQTPTDVFANLLATLQNGTPVEETSIDDEMNTPGSKRLDELRCELMKQKLENARIDRHIKMVQLDIMRQQLLLFKQTTGSLPS